MVSLRTLFFFIFMSLTFYMCTSSLLEHTQHFQLNILHKEFSGNQFSPSPTSFITLLTTLILHKTVLQKLFFVCSCISLSHLHQNALLMSFYSFAQEHRLLRPFQSVLVTLSHTARQHFNQLNNKTKKIIVGVSRQKDAVSLLVKSQRVEFIDLKESVELALLCCDE